MNVLKDSGCLFFTIPRALVDDGHLAQLSPSALRVYLLLFGMAQKHSAVEIELSDLELEDFTGMDHKSASKARTELDHVGLVTWRRGQGGRATTYALLHPTKHEPLKAPEGRRGVKKHHPQPGRSSRARKTVPASETAGAPAYPPSWDQIGSEYDNELTGKLPRARGNISPFNGENFPVQVNLKQ